LLASAKGGVNEIRQKAEKWEEEKERESLETFRSRDL